MYIYRDHKAYAFNKCDFVLETVTVKGALKMVCFPDSLKCANVRPVYKKRTHLIKRTMKFMKE